MGRDSGLIRSLYNWITGSEYVAYPVADKNSHDQIDERKQMKETEKKAKDTQVSSEPLSNPEESSTPAPSTESVPSAGAAPLPSGRIYYQYQRAKAESEDDVRDRLNEFLKKELARKAGRFVVNDQDRNNPLAAVERVLLGDGAERTFFLSNCSTGGRRSCWMADRGRCPIENEDECCLAKLPCNAVLLRPNRNIPSLARMFPSNEMLAIRAYLYNCPEQPAGCVAAITSLSWAPVCEARAFEREVRAICVSQEEAAKNWELHGHAGNLLTAETLAALPPISIETANNLRSWAGYLDWRNRLVAENARSIRYLRAQRNRNGSLSFFAVYDGSGEPPNLSWLRKEELEVLPLSASSDPWTFGEPENADRRLWKRPRATLLGEAESVRPVLAAATAIPDGCPWGSLGDVEVRVNLPDGERSAPGANEAKTADEDADLVLPKNIPETGFLRICQRGDRSLIERMQHTIDEFARNGSNAAPFLSSYLFDMSKARLPVRSTPIETFLDPKLTEDQKRAVQVMVDAPDIAFVQGPPGTGKTTVIAEAIYQFAKAGKSVLLASQSIAAVENAFAKLEHVPEIRIQLRRKTTKADVSESEDGRYSDEEVLREYYATLGRKARESVAVIDESDARRTKLLKVADELEPLVHRMEEEEEAAAEAVAQSEKAGEAVQAAVVRAEAASGARRAREASERLLDALPELAPGTLGDWARNVPQAVIAPLADAIRSAAATLKDQGVRLWSDLGEDEPHRPADIRLRALAGAAARLRQLRDVGIPALLKCIADWRTTSGDRLVDDESARTLQMLKIKLEETNRLRDEAEDAGNDEAAYERYSTEARRIRREIREVKANAETPVAAFREWFTVSDVTGRTLADAIEAADGNKCAVLNLVAGFEAFAANFLKELPAGERKTADAIQKATDAILEDDGADAALRKARQTLQNAETLVHGALERRRTFEEAAAPIMEKLRMLEPDGPAEPASALSWCRETAAAIERRVDEERAAHPWLEPVLREWSGLMSSPNDEDNARVLPTYLDSCNVVGITCTANPFLLGDRRFDVVIIDEVSKATPPELLGPMLRGAKTILVGDHRQLPPLFDEKEPSLLEDLAQREEENDSIPEEQKIVKRNFRKYEQMVEDSFFKRHFEQADPRLKSLLWVQHRMHPEIMDVINVFYEGKLRCGLPKGEADRLRDHGLSGRRIPWMSGGRHAYWADSTSAPDGKFFEEEQSGTSRVNGLEVRLIIRALNDMDAGLHGQLGDDGKPVKKTVGVVAFYGKQKRLLQREIRKLSFRHLKCEVETVDRFQGQQRDYILVSMTRNKRYSRGGVRSFIARFERINVAFSRARELLIVFGARDFFRRQPVIIPSLDGTGEAKKTMVYGHITDMLAQRGALLSASEIISASEWKALPPLNTGANPQTGNHTRQMHPEQSRRPCQKKGASWTEGRKNGSYAAYMVQRAGRPNRHPPRNK